MAIASSPITPFTAFTSLNSTAPVNVLHSRSPTSYKFRPLRISAACVSSAEKTRPRIESTSTSTTSLYDVLGIQMGASCHEIKTAYRRLARVLHPDVAANSQTQGTADEFMKIHEAYAILSDPERRANYDLMLFTQRRPVSFSYGSGSVSSGFSPYTRRTWETDQCW